MTTSGIVVAVDRDVCMGSGSCSFHAPNTFDLDDECRVVLLGSRDAAENLRAAADACPTRAITLTDESPGDDADAPR